MLKKYVEKIIYKLIIINQLGTKNILTLLNNFNKTNIFENSSHIAPTRSFTYQPTNQTSRHFTHNRPIKVTNLRVKLELSIPLALCSPSLALIHTYIQISLK